MNALLSACRHGFAAPIVACVLMGTSACDSSDGGGNTREPTPGDADAATMSIAVADGTTEDTLRARRIDYRVYAPADANGPVPIILVSHGGTGSDRGHTTGEHIGRALAAAGLLAVHVGHRASPDLGTHRIDRPTDVSVVLDRLQDGDLALPADFEGEADLGRVGHLGHSFGAYTAHAVAGATFDRTFTDARVRAIAVLSPQGAGQFGTFDRGPVDNTWYPIAIPTYDLVGEDEIDGNDIGTVNEPGWRLTPFQRYSDAADRLLSVIDDQDHREMWNLGSDDVKDWIATQLVRFFTVYVANGTPTLACEIGARAGLDVAVRTERRPAVAGSALERC